VGDAKNVSRQRDRTVPYRPYAAIKTIIQLRESVKDRELFSLLESSLQGISKSLRTMQRRKDKNAGKSVSDPIGNGSLLGVVKNNSQGVALA
jgi:hypothetical protein